MRYRRKLNVFTNSDLILSQTHRAPKFLLTMDKAMLIKPLNNPGSNSKAYLFLSSVASDNAEQ